MEFVLALLVSIRIKLFAMLVPTVVPPVQLALSAPPALITILEVLLMTVLVWMASMMKALPSALLALNFARPAPQPPTVSPATLTITVPCTTDNVSAQLDGSRLFIPMEVLVALAATPAVLHALLLLTTAQTVTLLITVSSVMTRLVLRFATVFQATSPTQMELAYKATVWLTHTAQPV